MCVRMNAKTIKGLTRPAQMDASACLVPRGPLTAVGRACRRPIPSILLILSSVPSLALWQESVFISVHPWLKSPFCQTNPFLSVIQSLSKGFKALQSNSKGLRKNICFLRRAARFPGRPFLHQPKSRDASLPHSKYKPNTGQYRPKTKSPVDLGCEPAASLQPAAFNLHSACNLLQPNYAPCPHPLF